MCICAMKTKPSCLTTVWVATRLLSHCLHSSDRRCVHENEQRRVRRPPFTSLCAMDIILWTQKCSSHWRCVWIHTYIHNSDTLLSVCVHKIFAMQDVNDMFFFARIHTFLCWAFEMRNEIYEIGRKCACDASKFSNWIKNNTTDMSQANLKRRKKQTNNLCSQ